MLWLLESVSLPGRRSPRLDGVSLAIREGVTAVLGPSGAGKTSLLNLLVAFERPSSGTITFHGETSVDRISVFWAPPQQGLWPHLTVRQHLTTVVSHSQQLAPIDIDGLLKQFDLLEHAAAKPDALSLGERSRLSVVRAICSQARVLVMDEPLAHVDTARCDKYWDTVREQCEMTGSSLVFSTHSPEVVLREAQQVVCLADGRVSFSGSVGELYDRPASRDLALMLGPCNWLNAHEATQWCEPESHGGVAKHNDLSASGSCVRPERLVVEPVANGPLTVESSTFVGSSAEVELRNEQSGTTRRFVFRPRGTKRFQRGERVILRLLLLLFAIGTSGCLRDDAPALSVKRESNWLMPPDGSRVPAPRGVTVSAANEYLVLDNAGRVLVFNENGDLKRQWWMPEYSVGKAEGICVLKDGRIAVADTHYHRVVLFDHDGQVTGMFGRFGSEPGEFCYPVKITQDPDEFIYVSEYDRNNRVQKFRPDGTYVLHFGESGTEPGQFLRPNGIAWFDHKLYVTDAFNSRIQVFTENGKLVEILGDSDKIAEVNYPYDITVDQNGDLYVAEYRAGRVSKFSRSGRLLGRYGTPGTGQKTAELKTPWGIAIDRRGRLYVCDTGNRRIVELEL